MYIPKAFAVTDNKQLFSFIQANSFGILFSPNNGSPIATHLPFLLDTTQGQNGTLWGHFAKANPHWQTDDQEVMAVFTGPHAYISPTWYQAENTVPTWNYTAVHVYGQLTVVEDKAQVMKILGDTVNYYEVSLPVPWRFDTSTEFNQKLSGGVVGFNIEITRLEGKWKLNQNHPVERRQKVVDALRQSTDHNEQAIAALMAENL